MSKKIKKSAKKASKQLAFVMVKPKKSSVKKPEVKLPGTIVLYEQCPICDGIVANAYQPTLENNNYKAIFTQSEISNASDRYGGSFQRVDRETEHTDLRDCIRCLKSEVRTLGYDANDNKCPCCQTY